MSAIFLNGEAEGTPDRTQERRNSAIMAKVSACTHTRGINGGYIGKTQGLISSCRAMGWVWLEGGSLEGPEFEASGGVETLAPPHPPPTLCSYRYAWYTATPNVLFYFQAKVRICHN